MFRPSSTPACQGTDEEAFFVPDGSSTYSDIATLRRVCSGCQVKTECLNYALNHAVLGYWGNTTEHQRADLRKKLNIIPQPLYLSYA
jgi:WhiB family redox-sensing transcriptional regulator